MGLVAFSCAYFLYRGPYRAWQHTIDLNIFYSASQAWLSGSDPYDAVNLSDIFRQAGGLVDPNVSVNPPLTFVLMTPLAMLPWPAAEAVWTILNVVLAAVSLWLVMSVARLSVREPRGLLFLAFAIALAPFHTSVSQGQLTILVTALVLASLWSQLHSRPVLSGICIAFAVALRPQMALVFLLLMLFRLQWKALFCGLSVLAVMSAVALGRMWVAGVDWLPTLQSNLAVLTQGGAVDPTAPDAYLMVNLQVLLNLVLADSAQMTLDVVTYAAVAASGAVLLLALRHRDDQEAHILLYAGCAVLTILAVYNRIYSATLLILPLAWAFSPLRQPRALGAAAIVVAATAVFLVPGAAALASLPLPPDLQSIYGTFWWRLLLVHQVYALVIILVGLLFAARYRDAPPARLGGNEASDVSVAIGFDPSQVPSGCRGRTPDEVRVFRRDPLVVLPTSQQAEKARAEAPGQAELVGTLLKRDRILSPPGHRVLLGRRLGALLGSPRALLLTDTNDIDACPDGRLDQAVLLRPQLDGHGALAHDASIEGSAASRRQPGGGLCVRWRDTCIHPGTTFALDARGGLRGLQLINTRVGRPL